MRLRKRRDLGRKRTKRGAPGEKVRKCFKEKGKITCFKSLGLNMQRNNRFQSILLLD
jgi:hypothetical protein